MVLERFKLKTFDTCNLLGFWQDFLSVSPDPGYRTFYLGLFIKDVYDLDGEKLTVSETT